MDLANQHGKALLQKLLRNLNECYAQKFKGKIDDNQLKVQFLYINFQLVHTLAIWDSAQPASGDPSLQQDYEALYDTANETLVNLADNKFAFLNSRFLEISFVCLSLNSTIKEEFLVQLFFESEFTSDEVK